MSPSLNDGLFYYEKFSEKEGEKRGYGVGRIKR
jgi:hypothetical protein